MSSHVPTRRFRPLALVAAVALLIASAWTIRALAGPAQGAEAASFDGRIEQSFILESELDRLLTEYTRRTTEVTTPSDHLILGNLQLEAGRTRGSLEWYVAARDSFDVAAGIVPDDARPHVGLARAALALHEFDTALGHAEDAERREGGRLDVQAIRVDALTAIGDQAMARDVLDRLNRLSADAPAVLVRRAQLAWLEGRIDLARSLAFDAVDPDDPNADRAAWYLAYAASMAFDTGALDEAGDASAQAIDLDPDGVTGLSVAARVAAARCDEDTAIDLYERAVARVPEPRLLSELALVLRRSGRPEEAREAEALVDAVAGVAEGVFARDIARHLAPEAPDRAMVLARSSLEGRTDPDGLAVLALAAYHAGDLPTASEAIDQALDGGYRRAEVLHLAGLIAEASGDSGSAAGYFDAATAVNPSFGAVNALPGTGWGC